MSASEEYGLRLKRGNTDLQMSIDRSTMLGHELWPHRPGRFSLDGMQAVMEGPGAEEDGDMSLDVVLDEIYASSTKLQLSSWEVLGAGRVDDIMAETLRASLLLDVRRRVILSESPSELEAATEDAVGIFENARKKVTGFVIPRNKRGELVNPYNTPLEVLYTLHADLNTAEENDTEEFLQSLVKRRIEKMKNVGAAGKRFVRGQRSSGSMSNEHSRTTYMASTLAATSGAGSMRFLMTQSSGGLPNSTEEAPTATDTGTFNVVYKFDAMGFGANEPMQLHVNIYDSEKKRFVHEDYVYETDKDGRPRNIDLDGRARAIFGGVLVESPAHAYVVVRAFRIGSLTQENGGVPKKTISFRTKAPTEQHFAGVHRRPYGACVYPVEIADVGDVDSISRSPVFMCKEESQFHMIQELIISKSKEVSTVFRASGIDASCGVFHEPVQTTIARFSDSDAMFLARPQKRNLAAEDFASSRNDVFITVVSANLTQGRKKSANNVAVTMEVLDKDSRPLEDVIHLGAGNVFNGSSQYHSFVIYHDNNPTWVESVRISLSALQENARFTSNDGMVVEGGRLRFRVLHASSKAERSQILDTVEFMLITPDGTVARDGEHTIHLPERGELKIKLRLCSTSMSQEQTLAKLLRHQILTDSEALRVCNAMPNIDVHSTIKVLRRVLDSLFGVMMRFYPQTTDLHRECSRSALVAILVILDSMTTKYTQFRGLVEQYYAEAFRNGDVYLAIMETVKNMVDIAIEKGTNLSPGFMKHLKLTCKMLRYAVKTIIASWKIRPDVQKDNESQFKVSLVEFLEMLTELLGLGDGEEMDLLIAVKGFILKSFHLILGDLLEVFSPNEVGMIARVLLVRVEQLTSSQLDSTKLKFLHYISLSPSPLIRSKRIRGRIEFVVGRMLAQYIGYSSRDEPYLAIPVLRKWIREMNDQALSELVDSFPEDQEKSTTAMVGWTLENPCFEGFNLTIAPFYPVFPALTSLTEKLLAHDDMELLEKFGAVKDRATQIIEYDQRQETLMSYCSLMFVMSSDEFTKLYESVRVANPGEGREVEMASSMLQISLLLLNINPGRTKSVTHNSHSLHFPPDWITIRIVVVIAIAKTLTFLINCTDSVFNAQDVARVFQIGVGIFGVQEFYHESCMGFSDKLHSELLILFERLWSKLSGETRFEVLCEILEDKTLVGICLVDDERILNFGMQMYHEALKWEYDLTGTFDRVEGKTFDLLYRLGSENDSKADSFAWSLFSSLESLELSDVTYASCLKQYLVQIKRVYKSMASLSKYHTEIYEFEKSNVLLEIIDFLGRFESREKLYHQYILDLTDMHLALGSSVEAAVTLKRLCLDKMNFDGLQHIGALKDWPAESHGTRKLRMWNWMIDILEKAEDYERGIEMLELLKNHYLNSVYDMNKVASILERQATYYRAMHSAERYYSVYFRVCYYGSKFPDDLTASEWIVKGGRLESVMDFTNRLRRRWQGVVIQMASDIPNAEKIKSSGEMLISITTLKVGDRLLPDRGVMPKQLHQYRINNMVDTFFYKKPVNKSKEKKPSNEFRDLWVLQTVIKSEDTFPNITRHSRIISSKQIWVNPVQSALISLKEKSAELADRIETVAAASAHEDVNLLSMILNGMIDAAVNGGTKHYIEAFLSPEYAAEFPDRAQLLTELRKALQQQSQLLGVGLELFRAKCGKSLQGLYDHLSGFYEESKKFMSSQGVLASK